MNNQIISGLAVVALVLSGLTFFGVEDGERGPRGADGRDGVSVGGGGPTHFDAQYFQGGHVDGGHYVATTTDGNTTADASNTVTRSGKYVRYLAINADEATVYTFLATSSLTNFIPEAGDCFTQMIENSGDSNLTLAAGTGMDLQEPDGQNVIIGANNYASTQFCRTSASDMVVIVDETIPGD